MKYTINEAQCLGCKRCVKTCPDVFQMDGEKAKVVKAESNSEKAQMAFEDCPAGAIRQA
ncbi:ferredoxin [Synergistes jonesii]|uniref:ferredoxin n=1 Tax=Synergistes jonesii TaxID=2754 RepID=UPI0009DDF33A|nr:ferredoxin [Synergistes jonesii]